MRTNLERVSARALAGVGALSLLLTLTGCGEGDVDTGIATPSRVGHLAQDYVPESPEKPECFKLASIRLSCSYPILYDYIETNMNAAIRLYGTNSQSDRDALNTITGNMMRAVYISGGYTLADDGNLVPGEYAVEIESHTEATVGALTIGQTITPDKAGCIKQKMLGYVDKLSENLDVITWTLVFTEVAMTLGTKKAFTGAMVSKSVKIEKKALKAFDQKWLMDTGTHLAARNSLNTYLYCSPEEVEEGRPDARRAIPTPVDVKPTAGSPVAGTHTLAELKSLITEASDSAEGDAREAALVSGLLIGAVYPGGAWKYNEEEPDLQDQNLSIATTVQVPIDELYEKYRDEGIPANQQACLLAVALSGAENLATQPDRIDVVYGMLESLDLSTPINKVAMYELFYEQYSGNVNDRSATKLNLDGTRTITNDFAACDV